MRRQIDLQNQSNTCESELVELNKKHYLKGDCMNDKTFGVDNLENMPDGVNDMICTEKLRSLLRELLVLEK